MLIWIPFTADADAALFEEVFDVALDGLFSLSIYLCSEHDLGQLTVEADDKRVFDSAGTQEYPGYWRCGSVDLPRGRHVLRVQAGGKPMRALLTDEPELVTDGQAQLLWDNRPPEQPFDRRRSDLTIEQRQLMIRHGFFFAHEHDAEYCDVPSGVPLGGIGAGKVEMTPQGFFTALTINNNQDSPLYRLPGSYFALRTGDGQGAVTRLLQTEAVDQPFVPVERIDADLTFPEADLAYLDPALPVAVKLHAFSPHVPYEEQYSALPCAFFRFTLSNPADHVQDVKLLFSWESLINVGGHVGVPNHDPERLLPLVYHTWNYEFAWSNRQGNYQEANRASNGTGLTFRGRTDHHNPNAFGEHLIWTPEQARIISDRDLIADEARFRAWLEAGAEGDFQPTSESEFRAGALLVEKRLAPGETATVDFVLAWHMPTFINRGGEDDSVRYAEWFGNVADVLAFVGPRRDTLLARTRAVREALEASSLPAWFMRKLLNDRFVAVTNTIFTRDGKFSVNEAPSGMHGCLGTLDQRACSGAYWTTFFPALDACELDLFIQRQAEDGAMPHDLGHGVFRSNPEGVAWPDLVDAYVIQVHRHYLRTGNGSFLEKHIGPLMRALAWAIALDEHDTGIPTLKPGRGTTYDNQHWDGISAFIATMHEAALVLGADLSERHGESCGYQWRKLAVKAHVARLIYLWVDEEGGGYFRNAYDLARENADDSCFIAALAGEWAMAAGGIRPRLDIERWHAAVRSIRRKTMFADGMTDQSARADTCPVFLQYPVAYFGAAALWAGLPEPAWEFLELQERIVTRAPSTHFNQVLTYDRHGKPHGLPYYMTAPVTWLFLDALAGVVCDVPGGSLTLGSEWLFRAARRVPVFLTKSWFMVETTITPDTITLSCTPLAAPGKYMVSDLKISLPDGLHVLSATINQAQTGFSVDEHGVIGLPVQFDPGWQAVSVTLTLERE